MAKGQNQKSVRTARRCVLHATMCLLAVCLLAVTLLLPSVALRVSAKASYMVEDVTPYTAYTTTRLNIRTGPGVRWDWIVTLDEGAEVTVTGVASTGWLRIRTEDIAEGFTSARFYADEKALTASAADAADASTVKDKEETAAESKAEEVKEEPDAESKAEETKEEASTESKAEEAKEEMAAESKAEEVKEEPDAESKAEKVKEETSGEKTPEKAVAEAVPETVAGKSGEKPAAADGHVHNYIAVVTKEATCANVGVITYTCAECGDSYTESVPRKEHTPGAWEVARAATWTKSGVQYQNCAVCGQTLVSEEIPANPLPLILIIAGVCLAAVIAIVVLLARNGRKNGGKK